MKVQFKAIAFAAATLVLGHAAWAGEAEAAYQRLAARVPKVVVGGRGGWLLGSVCGQCGAWFAC